MTAPDPQTAAPLSAEAESLRRYLLERARFAEGGAFDREVVRRLAAISGEAAPVDGLDCRPKSDDRWLCETHPGGMFRGRTSGGSACTLAREEADDGRS